LLRISSLGGLIGGPFRCPALSSAAGGGAEAPPREALPAGVQAASNKQQAINAERRLTIAFPLGQYGVL
jgi:hypothetical protein